MKSRDELQREAKEIVRVISMYGVLEYRQVLRLFPHRGEAIRNLVSRLVKEKRLYYQPENGTIAIAPEKAYSRGTVTAFWVLLDFMDSVEYHTVSDFPVNISFFAKEESYEIIVIPPGQENLVRHALYYAEGDSARRLVVVDFPAQIPQIRLPQVKAYCTVSVDGTVQYYHTNLPDKFTYEVSDGST